MPSRGPLLGHNDNVSHRGTSLHVQTEDLGPRRKQLTTHVFADGGRIVHTQRSSYEDVVDDDAAVERIRERMRAQHRAAIEALRRGEFDAALAGATIDEDGRGGYKFVTRRGIVETPFGHGPAPTAAGSEPPSSTPRPEPHTASPEPPRHAPTPLVREVSVHPVAAPPRIVTSAAAPPVAPPTPSPPPSLPAPSPPPSTSGAAPASSPPPILEVVASSSPPSSTSFALEPPMTLRGLGAGGRDGVPRAARPPSLRFGEGHAPGRRLDQLLEDLLARRASAGSAAAPLASHPDKS
ncbi:MAG: hypothetical protein FJ096_15320 [Deltaproteobacteria bacterium]|nr:hypothetical protein [Deltaproteobacteria bacterium]